MTKTDFYKAIVSDNYEGVFNSIKNGIDVNEPYWERGGKTPLLLAASCGNPKIINLLCNQKNCYINSRTIHGETALHLAIAAKNNVYDCVDVLLLNGCSAEIQENIGGRSPLHALVRFMIVNEDYSERAINTLNNLIEKCETEAKDNKGRTALHLAAGTSSHVEFLRILLACDAMAQNQRGETALHEALEMDNSLEVIELLAPFSDLSLGNNYGETPLHVAARKRRCSIFSYLLLMGAPINSKDVKGNTALHLSAERGHVDAVTLLANIEGIEINAQNNEGLTPLHVAVESGFQMVVEAENCDVSVKTKDSQTALDLAQENYRIRSQPQLSDMLENEVLKRFTHKAI